MAKTIKAPVGKGKKNISDDVELVQTLLNGFTKVAKLRKLKTDGFFGPKTQDAIGKFQVDVCGMKAYGYMLPGKSTIKALQAGPKKIEAEAKKDARKDPKAADKAAAKEPPAPAEVKALWKQKVDSRVLTKSNTKQIINGILPHIANKDVRIVSGYLDDDAQFWKVNHHWDYLRWMILHCLKLDIDDKTKKALKAVLANLHKSKPKPLTGYRTGGIGQPDDKSTPAEIRKRWKLLKQAKKDWITIYKKKGLVAKSPRKIKSFKHPSSPIRPPGTSKHGTGYAIDMVGNYGDIKSVSAYLGATLIYTEPGNMHVEFANGVAKKKVRPK